MNRHLLAPLVLAASLTTAQAQTPTQSYPLTISPLEAAKLLSEKKATLIDIRRPDEWKQTGVAENAELADMSDPLFEAKLSKITSGDRTKPIMLICRTATRTRTLQQALLQQGYTAVINVEGGMIGNAADKGWIARDLPVKAFE